MKRENRTLNKKSSRLRQPVHKVLVVAASLASVGAHAIEIETGNDELKVRWDNTVKYSC